jgi:hypothetical protein
MAVNDDDFIGNRNEGLQAFSDVVRFVEGDDGRADFHAGRLGDRFDDLLAIGFLWQRMEAGFGSAQDGEKGPAGENRAGRGKGGVREKKGPGSCRVFLQSGDLGVNLMPREGRLQACLAKIIFGCGLFPRW